MKRPQRDNNVHNNRISVARLEDECFPEIGRKISRYLKSCFGAEETEASSLLLIPFDVERDSM
jgi:hypothetical protein